MTISEAQKKATRRYVKKTGYAAQKKYAKEHIRRITLNVTPEQHDKFKETCAKNGDSMNNVLKQYMLRYIENGGFI